MTELEQFHSDLLAEIKIAPISSDEGGIREQVFTKIATDMLAESGGTENVSVASYQKNFGTKNQQKINGFGMHGDNETVDLFISVFYPGSVICTVTKREIDQAATRIYNFYNKAINNTYEEDIDPSNTAIFQFASTLATYEELRSALVRVNAFILTNGTYKGEVPAPRDGGQYKFYFQVIDINFLYRISKEARMPVEIDFENEQFKVPCVSMEIDGACYKSCIAILPGKSLNLLYERFGSRLLEQNVRAFLQFSGKINKGIRQTIRDNPQMFLAYNNGISATADHIELDETQRFIKRVSNLQIVNGGQTTASIYYANRDRIDISDVFVQTKFSIINQENQDQFAEIVSRISRYSNTQNKVNEADFTANNPALIELEKLSRTAMTPSTASRNYPTFWFFERARGQYKTERGKRNATQARFFDKMYPKDQVFTKVEFAKYQNAFDEPHMVVRGNEKNYSHFVFKKLPKTISEAYFKDSIARAILFKTADKRYGTKRDSFCIGQIKQVAVPYSLALLQLLTDNRIDLKKIWNNQCISQELSDELYNLMVQINDFIIEESPVSHYIEWAKKEECWKMVKSHRWQFWRKLDRGKIQGDLLPRP